MRKPILILTLTALLCPAATAQTVFVSPDVPTDPSLGTVFLPWDVAGHGPAGFAPVPVLTVSGIPVTEAVDALHKMDEADNWLFSIESPSDLAGALSAIAEPRDVIRLDAGAYGFFFCGGSVADPVPLESNVDAVYLDQVGGDSGDLILSFDVPTTISGSTFDPADLVRYEPTVISPTCVDWKLVGVEFDASAAGAGIPTSVNVIAADMAAGVTLMALDVPGDLAPSAGPVTYVPGQIASWDGVTFDLFDTLTSWPISSQVDALTCQANPGRVPLDMIVTKSTITPGDLTLSWSPSCSSGAEDYGIYRGTLGTYYSHVEIDCFDDGADRTEEVVPTAGDEYYLVVAHNNKEEGTYGFKYDAGIFTERPQAALPIDRCEVVQTLTACP